MNLTIADYKEDNEEEVLQLVKLSLGESDAQARTPAWWRWKHFENPFGPSQILLAWKGSELVGLRAYLRWRFVTPVGSLKAFRAVDTATHPRYQRQGVFRHLTREANHRAGAVAADLVFNTPNQKSLPGYLSMGWFRIGKPRLYLRPMSGLALIAHLKRRAQADPALAIPGGEPCRIGPELSDRDPLGIRTPRSGDYLRWKFEQHPTVPYRIVRGGDTTLITRAVRRSGRQGVIISEMFNPTASRLRALRTAFRTDYLIASARPGSPEARWLRLSGFLPAAGLGLTMVVLPLSRRGEMALDLGKWDLSAGDLELM